MSAGLPEPKPARLRPGGLGAAAFASFATSDRGLARRAVACEASKGWWGKKDSNLRSHKTADLQSAPFATRDTPPLNNIASPPVEMAATRPLMTLKSKDPMTGSRLGAFMGETPRQSQSTPAANPPHDSPN